MKSNKKRILIIADSLAMPRIEIAYENTWIYKLQEHFSEYHFIDKTRRASTSERLVEEGGGVKNIMKGADLLELYNPDIVITQIGITDCSPRLVKKEAILTKIINHAPAIIRNAYYSYKKKYGKRLPQNADVSELVFKENWKNYIERANKINTIIICILISPVTKEFMSKSPYIVDSITKYNKILIELQSTYSNFRLLSPIQQDLIEELTCDEFHLNKQGHMMIFEALKNNHEFYI